MKLSFSLIYHTKLGEHLQLIIQEKSKERIYDLSYTQNGVWRCEFDYFSRKLTYKYRLVNQNQEVLDEELVSHFANFPYNYEEFSVFDEWNLKNFPENFLINKVLENQFPGFNKERITVVKQHTHWFKIQVPLPKSSWKVVLLGSVPELGNWDYNKVIHLAQTDIGNWEIPLEINSSKKFEYKYGIFDVETQTILDLELGENRVAEPNLERELLHILNDKNFKTQEKYWFHGAGVSVPVFSLRTENSFGVGEFSDIKQLADWSSKIGFKIIQLLPINDTTADYSWMDSYPYAAVSNSALHPIYISLEDLDFKLNSTDYWTFLDEKLALNALPQVDYENVIQLKWKYLKKIFSENETDILKDRNFKKYIKDNENWLVPYSVFCVLRDKYKTPNFNEWKTFKRYVAGKIKPFFSPKNKEFSQVMLHSWVQYQLHLQLTNVVDYAHKLGVSLKGDLPIGIYRYSVEAWTEPELFEMNFQAGAPPDFFSGNGQNWGFPTCNWEEMSNNNYSWWKNRFQNLEQYFDALRIDHVLGFFRIWRIPVAEIKGSMGYFHPANPIYYSDFQKWNLDFRFERFCLPFINDEILNKFFGDKADSIKFVFLDAQKNGIYHFKGKFSSQKEIQSFCNENEVSKVIQEQLLHLYANRLFIVEDNNGEKVFHPRFNNFSTESFRFLNDSEKEKIYKITQDYFFEKQEDLWEKNGKEKLSKVLQQTKMLICAEDLGFVPKSVPKVLDELAIFNLKVQTMSDENIPFYKPEDAGYKSVFTTSTHDSETFRLWWKNGGEAVQQFYNQQLQQFGSKPEFLQPELMQSVLQQDLNSKASLVIFPIQDILAANPDYQNNDLESERINIPSVFPHFWRYRIPFTIENLISNENFNSFLKNLTLNSGRI